MARSFRDRGRQPGKFMITADTAGCHWRCRQSGSAGRIAKVNPMRFATIRTADGTTAARFDGDTLTPLDAPDVGALLAAAGGPGGVSARVGAAPVLVAEADFAPVVPSPSKVICVGLNYRTHIQETGRELPEYPTLFAKFAETLMGPYDDLALPSVSNRVDWEAELGLIIGRPVYRADAAEAAGAIAGYTVCNDVSMRDFQRRTLQWLAGKMFQHSTPGRPVPGHAGRGRQRRRPGDRVLGRRRGHAIG